MSKPRWTPERDDLLRRLRASDMRRQDMVVAINEGYDAKVNAEQMSDRARTIGAARPERIASKHDHSKATPIYRTDDAYRAMSMRFAQALRDAGIRYQGIVEKTPPRMGIMSGRDPRTEMMIAARSQMARQNRLATGEW
ncbi:hypothetical protein UFOVP469_49 [uncultured Caudovirales phage]|uniref:Uncharacterized protein n=1 Tax=uncultured Caudovirales phage TaxID=2100421 RepID=A0A6J5MEV7_9CAUD|nr:hypothetical protein UFOVP469_49 [uncultured Caudovirales phage]CAB4189889.1 hypothetical protein UFOVP1200_22 [uncultured Caudovirales phage]